MHYLMTMHLKKRYIYIISNLNTQDIFISHVQAKIINIITWILNKHDCIAILFIFNIHVLWLYRNIFPIHVLTNDYPNLIWSIWLKPFCCIQVKCELIFYKQPGLPIFTISSVSKHDIITYIVMSSPHDITFLWSCKSKKYI